MLVTTGVGEDHDGALLGSCIVIFVIITEIVFVIVEVMLV